MIKELKKIKQQEPFFKKIIPLVGKNKDLDRLIFRLEKQEAKGFKKLKIDILHIIKGFQ